MNIDENDVEALSKLGAGKILEKVYDDLASPAVKKVGEALETVLDLANTLLLPARLLNARAQAAFQANMERYREKLASIDIIDITPVPPEIGVPVLEHFTYTTNAEIADAFANLLATASSTKTAHLAHPAFLQMIERLSPDEATLLTSLGDATIIPYIQVVVPVVNDSAYVVTSARLTDIDGRVLEHDQNVDMYLDNLIAIGFLQHFDGKMALEDERRYERLKAKHILAFTSAAQRFSDRTKYKDAVYLTGHFEVTRFGRKFLRACLSGPSEDVSNIPGTA